MSAPTGTPATTATAPAAPVPASTVLTPTVRAGARRSLFWAAAGAFVLLVAFGILALVGVAGTAPRLSPENPAPDGARAVAEVLAGQGVDVRPTETLDDTIAAASDPATTTIVLFDEDGQLDAAQRQTLLETGAHLVVLEAGFAELASFAPGVRSAGVPDDDPLRAGCSLPAAASAATVSPGGLAYRAGPGAELCLTSDSDTGANAYSYIRVDTAGTVVSIVGATEALTNAAVTDLGNAAFALTLLGENETLVWYRPSVLDAAGGSDPSELTPGWVNPAIVLLILVAAAAAFWRGRRFGPLVVEDLPVVVRASETMEGRARLYERSSARVRALDSLRMATLSRLATRVGLGATAGLEQVCLAVAAALGVGPAQIRSVLVEATPETDADLVRLSDRLRELETSLADRLRP